MDFNNRVLTTVELFGQSIWITETHLSTWIIMAVLIGIALLIRVTLKNFTEVPRGRQNIVELLVETFDNFVKSIMGPENRGYGKWFLRVFVFILASNFSDLFNLRPPTADVSTTLALSVSTFAIVHASAIAKVPKAYVKSFFKPFFVFLPINIMGDLSIIVSLGFRLFGNILSGLIIVGLIYYLLPSFLTIVIPAVLHVYFDVLVGSIQAFIFTMLSMTFIRNKIIVE